MDEILKDMIELGLKYKKICAENDCPTCPLNPDVCDVMDAFLDFMCLDMGIEIEDNMVTAPEEISQIIVQDALIKNVK